MALPICIIVIPIIIFFPIFLCRRTKQIATNIVGGTKEEKDSNVDETTEAALANQTLFQKYRDLYITTVIVGLFLVHPSLVKQTLMNFSCLRADSTGDYGDGTSFLAGDMNMMCWSELHWIFTLLVAALSLIVYVFGILALGMLLLRNNHHRFHKATVRKKYCLKSGRIWE
eukprot:151278_1